MLPRNNIPASQKNQPDNIPVQTRMEYSGLFDECITVPSLALPLQNEAQYLRELAERKQAQEAKKLSQAKELEQKIIKAEEECRPVFDRMHNAPTKDGYVYFDNIEKIGQLFDEFNATLDKSGINKEAYKLYLKKRNEKILNEGKPNNQKVM